MVFILTQGRIQERKQKECCNFYRILHNSTGMITTCISVTTAELLQNNLKTISEIVYSEALSYWTYWISATQPIASQ